MNPSNPLPFYTIASKEVHKVSTQQPLALARVEVSRSSAACYPGQEPLTLDRGVSRSSATCYPGQEPLTLDMEAKSQFTKID